MRKKDRQLTHYIMKMFFDELQGKDLLLRKGPLKMNEWHQNENG